MKLYNLVLISLLVLSCKDEAVNEVKKEVIKYPDHPITYEIKGDSVVVHRVYPSKVRIDSVTLELLSLESRALTPITFNYNDTLLFDSIQSEVDRFNQIMVDKRNFAELAPINIVVEDTVLFEDLYNSVLRRFKGRYRSIWINSHFFTMLNNDYSSSGYGISYSNGVPYIVYEDYGFSERFASNSLDMLDSLHNTITEGLNTDDKVQYSYNESPEPQPRTFYIKTNSEPVIVEDICSALSLIDNGSYIQFQFNEVNELHEGINFMRGKYNGKAFIGLYSGRNHNGEEEIKIELDTLYSLVCKSNYPFGYESHFVSNDSSDSLFNYSIHGSQVTWHGIKKEFNFFNSGFVIEKYDIVPFLDEKLKLLGLNFEERYSFRSYWAKEIAKNEYSLIHFATDEYEEAVPMIVTPEPETKIRIMMCFKAVDSSFQIVEQELTPVVTDRSGFTVVEWGGCNYDRDQLAQ